MPIPFHLTGFMVMMMMTKGEGRRARGGQPFFYGWAIFRDELEELYEHTMNLMVRWLPV